MAQSVRSDTLISPTMREPVVGGRYALEQLIAEGGMALVYRGRHLELDHQVAIKLVRPELAFDAEATARFLNEARTIAKLRSPHVARVLDSGCSEPGHPFMVLEYLEGGDLRKLLDVNSTVPIESAVSMVLEAIEALAEAHAHGIVHRDIKPENLFLARGSDGSVTLKVLDFGICKRPSPKSRVLTLQGKTLGSPHYMAPEQITSPETVDARADIWALGVVLYELLSGYQPFTGETLSSLCAQVVHAEPRKPLRRVNPDVPAALERIVMRCLKKDPAERYASVIELAGALSPFAKGGAEKVERIRRVGGDVTPAPRSMTPLAVFAGDTPPFRPGWRRAGSIVSIAAMAAVVTVFFTRYTTQTLSAGASLLSGWSGEVASPAQVSIASLPEEPRPSAVPAAPSPEPTVEVLQPVKEALQPVNAPLAALAAPAVREASAAAQEPEREQVALPEAAVRRVAGRTAPARVVRVRAPERTFEKPARASWDEAPRRPLDERAPANEPSPRELLLAPSSSASEADVSELIEPYDGGR
jgi:serine/threonine-protein kinase